MFANHTREKNTFEGKIVETLARNTNIYKFANFAGLEIPYFTTVRDQTFQFH